jgi:hypothetical protein
VLVDDGIEQGDAADDEEEKEEHMVKQHQARKRLRTMQVHNTPRDWTA